MDKSITSASPERVTLAEAYFHFKACNPSERQATIDLVSVIREERLELRAGKVTELRPGGETRSTYDKAVPTVALNDRLGMKFDWEPSRALWERPPPDSYFTFEDITVSRDQVLKLRPVPAATIGSAAKRRGGLAPPIRLGCGRCDNFVLA